MTQVNFMRHSNYFGPEDASNQTLHIIGCGATGSWVAMLAARMGWHNFVLWDSDTVESHNLPNQTYDHHQVGMKKVDALEECLLRFNDQVSVEKYDTFFEASNDDHVSALEDYVFIAVDSLSARKEIMSILKQHVFVHTVFETKMGFTHATLNVIDTQEIDIIDNYISALKNDDEVEESACGAKIITTLTTIVAANLVHLLCGNASSSRNKSTKTYGKHIFSLTNEKLSTFTL